MTEHNSLSSGQFLFHRTASRDLETPQVGESRGKSDPGFKDALKTEFPELITGERLAECGVDRMRGHSVFGALAIHIGAGEKTPHPVGLDAARAIESAALSEDSLWGLIDDGCLGLYLPNADSDRCRQVAESIRQRLAEKQNPPLTIGIAVYPTLAYTPEVILENARKALDHAAFFGPGSTVVFDAVSLNVSGDRLYQSGNLTGAVSEFQMALKLDPENVNVHNSLGVCHGLLGDMDRALEEFEIARQLDSDEITALYNIGLVHQLCGRNQEALEKFLEAGRIGEDIFEIAFQTGKLYCDLSEWERARGFLEKAIQLDPDASVTYRYLGMCHSACDRLDDAVSAYQKAVKLNPNDADALSALGHTFDRLGKESEIALVFCRQSVDIAPENGLFHHRLGLLCLNQGRHGEALEAFRAACERGYDSASCIDEVEDQLSARAS